jgi:precorrin-8X/cobalt-precorrin-8 methylmutase
MNMSDMTRQDTEAGRRIEEGSFDIIDREAGDHSAYDDDEWQVVRRMIHASADFDFNGLTIFHPFAIKAGIFAIMYGRHIVVDVEMIRAGLSPKRLDHFDLDVRQFISRKKVAKAARREGTTRAVQAMRLARDKGLLDGAIIAIGNAPTALLEVVRMIREENLRPALVIGMPVGFVSAAEAKEEMENITDIPWIVTRGRKGGTTLVVSAIHALMAMAEKHERELEEKRKNNPKNIPEELD